MSPILIGLGGTATGLGLIVTGVLMALWRKHAATPAKPKPPQQPSIATFAGKGEEEDGNPDLIPTTALTNHLTGELRHTLRYALYTPVYLYTPVSIAQVLSVTRSTGETERKKIYIFFFFFFFFIYFLHSRSMTSSRNNPPSHLANFYSDWWKCSV